MRSLKSIHSSYEFLGLAGSGQYGQVYCARRRSNQRIVALKELPLHRFPTHALLRELRFLLMLDHPNLTRCEALEHAQEGRYLVLEYCEGGTLRDWLEQNPPYHLHQILHWIRQILLGLEHAHQAGVIHCDVKPENVLLHLTAAGWTMKLTDFGIAKVHQPQTTDLSMTGSAAYMAPERFYGQFSPAVDIYAVGVMLYEMLLGSRPFSGSPGQLMHDHLNRRLKLGTELPPLVRPIVQRALEKLPARRYPSAAAMAKDIDAILPQLQQPLSCWVGPLLPPSSLQVQTTLTLPTPPDQILWWHNQIWWTQGGQLWRTDPHKETSTLVLTLEQPLRYLAPWGTGLALVTPQHLYHWLPQTPPTLLRTFRDPWRYWIDAEQILWATPRHYGRIQWAEPAPLLPHPRRCFYQQAFPQPLPEPPLIWSDGTYLGLGISRQGHCDLYHHPLSPWQPIPWQHPPLWSLPLPMETGIPLPQGVVLLPKDPQQGLIWVQFRPLRVKRLYLPNPCRALQATPQGFYVLTQAQQLLAYTSLGEGESQTLLPQPFHSFDAQGSLWLAPQPTQLWRLTEKPRQA
ncbi:MAG: serine/threonine-protein kinase [Thermostichales cyanobacterium SZTDM-1c_bins_54]